MVRLNNKGQSLVMFILIMPILLFIMVLVIDIGNILGEKQELNNVNEMVINYGLDNISTIDENKLVSMINLNTKKMKNIEVEISNEQIKITLKKDVNSLISQVFNIKKYEIVSSYVGKFRENKKIVERVAWCYGNL